MKHWHYFGIMAMLIYIASLLAEVDMVINATDDWVLIIGFVLHVICIYLLLYIEEVSPRIRKNRDDAPKERPS